MTKSKKYRRRLFWFLSIAVALASYRFVVLGMAAGFPNMAHQLVSPNVMFYLHVIAAPIALAIAPFQLSERFRRNAAIHRMLGRIYCASVFVGGVSGFVIGMNAMHGPVAQSGFVLLALLWLGVTFRALRFARQRNFARHRDWMIRSAALTFAGVTLRVWLPLELLSGLSFETAYQVVAWLCWVPNALVAELIIRAIRAPARRLAPAG